MPIFLKFIDLIVGFCYIRFFVKREKEKLYICELRESLLLSGSKNNTIKNFIEQTYMIALRSRFKLELFELGLNERNLS